MGVQAAIRSRVGKRSVLFGLLGIVLLSLGSYVWLARSGTPSERGLRELVEAFEEQRPVEGRLSGGFHAGSYEPVAEKRVRVDRARLDNARDLLLGSSSVVTTSERVNYARLLLLDGKLAEAQYEMQYCNANDSENPSFINDYGVCLLETGRLEDALDQFEKALKLNPSMSEAAFNRALTFEKLELRSDAAGEFDRLRSSEQDESWRREIEDRISKLTPTVTRALASTEIIGAFNSAYSGDSGEVRSIAEKHFEVLRRYGIGDLSEEYIRSAISRDQETAQTAMGKLVLLGDVFVQTKDDPFMADVAQFWRSLDERRLKHELRLMQDFGRAIQVYRTGQFEEARRRFESVQRDFERDGNAMFVVTAANLVSFCSYELKQFSAVEQTLGALVPLVEERGWRYDQLRVYNLLALARSLIGYDSQALRDFSRVMTLCRTMNESEAKPLQYMSIAYWHLGNLDKALKCLRDSTADFLTNENLPLLSLDRSKELANNYLTMADIFRLQERHNLALLFGTQAVRYAESINDSDFVSQAASFTAVELAYIQNFDKAENLLTQAFDHLNKIPGPGRRFAQSLALSRAGTVAALAGDLQRSLKSYSEAQALTETAEDSAIPLIRVLKGRAEAYLISGSPYQARADLLKAIDEIENYRARISDVSYRRDFIDLSHDIFDRLILLNASQPEFQESAFDVSEKSRARTLLDQVTIFEASGSQTGHTVESAPATPLNRKQVSGALPPDTTLLEYAVTKFGTVIFIVRRDEFKVVRSSATTDQLDRLVIDYLAAIKERQSLPEITRLSREIFDLVILPALPLLTPETHVCIVPDKALHLVPFAALLSPSDQYLVESFTLTYAPSASLLIRCLGRNSTLPAKPRERMLAVGDPLLDRATLEELPQLPEAAQEALQCASMYAPDSVLLTGSDATEDAVRRQMQHCDIIQFAVHCLMQEKSPWLAGLVLTKTYPDRNESVATSVNDEERDGILYLEEVYKISLPRTRLVVLSACQSALGQYYRGEGILSLVHPFIAARVPTVVATLWPVDSKYTSRLMIDFHSKRITNGAQTAEALRRAQIAMARSDEFKDPYYWASFVVVGAR